MIYNLLFGGAAGQGIETLASTLEKLLQRRGFEIFTIRDYMSRIRGGHNFIQIRFGNEEINSHDTKLDGIIALNEETILLHSNRLKETGFVIVDAEVVFDDQRKLTIPLKSIAKQIGNSRVLGNVALGAVLKLFNLEITPVELAGLLGIRDELRQQQLAALQAGFNEVKPSYEIKPAGANQKILINGNEAIAWGALAAGCKFYSAYPMTPATSIMNYLSSKMREAKIVVEQAEDEIAAINMAIGASYAGVRAMTGTSGGGFALMVEAYGLASMLELPLVIAEIQRPGPTTGFPTRTEQGDLKFVISAGQGECPRMVIALRNPEDAFYQTIRAFNLADKYQIPVLLLGDQFLADTTRTVSPFDFSAVTIERYLSHEQFTGDQEYQRYEITDTGISPRIIPGKLPGKIVVVDSDEHDEYGNITESAEVRVRMNDKRLRKMDYLQEELQEPAFTGDENYNTLLIGWGSLDGPIKDAVEMLNIEGQEKYGGLIFGDIWPLPVKLLIEKVGKAARIINVEQNATGQLASLIREKTGIKCDTSILKYDGRPMSLQDIYNGLKGVIS